MMDIQYLYKLIMVFIYAAFATFVAISYFDKKLRKYKFYIEDRYKPGNPKIPTMGALSILAGVLLSLAVSQLIMYKYDVGKLFIFYFIVIVYSLYGIVDDLFAFKQRYDKILILLILSFPIASLVKDSSIFGIDFGYFYLLFLAPFYIMVIANLVNVYSGYNGLASGLSLILLIAATIKSYMVNGLNNIVYVFPVLAGLIVFYPKNWFPAKLHEGNLGAFLFGSTLGAFLIVNKSELFGVFIMIPHIINFVLDTYILVIKKIPDVKFGSVRKDGTIEVPYSVRHKSLKFIVCYYLRLKEWQATLILLIITLIFSAIGVIWL